MTVNESKGLKKGTRVYLVRVASPSRKRVRSSPDLALKR
jgi:hypothetical protein